MIRETTTRGKRTYLYLRNWATMLVGAFKIKCFGFKTVCLDPVDDFGNSGSAEACTCSCVKVLQGVKRNDEHQNFSLVNAMENWVD